MQDFPMKKIIYKGDATREISFPLGGIGTGCIGLTGWGSLFEFEIFNRPNKLSTNGFSFFAIKAEKDGENIDARVLMNDPKFTRTGFSEIPTDEFYSNYGFGPSLNSMAGLPHFPGEEFVGSYPFAEIDFEYEKFPGKIHLEAFNPLIPLNDRDSSIPAAFMEYEVENTSDTSLDYTVCGVFNNPFKKFSNEYESNRQNPSLHSIRMYSCDEALKKHEQGNLCLSVVGDNVTYQEYLYEGRWAFDTITMFWNDFLSSEGLKNRKFSERADSACCLASKITLKPGEKKKVRFVISWYFPNNINYWEPITREDIEQSRINIGDELAKKKELSDDDMYELNLWKNYYATLFVDSVQCGEYCHLNWDRLREESNSFRELLFSSTLPIEIIDAVSANISILKTPTCLRNEDGSFLAWEGCGMKAGSCEGSCTHVWNYAYALPFLFPNLERSMRENEFKYSMNEDGAINFRIKTPLGRKPPIYFPCADGQFGGIMKIYRDFKIDGDKERLVKIWPNVVKALEFAWSKNNKFRWDPDKTGVLSGRQHHTLDMELYSPNSWLAGMYLGALKAGSIMADIVGDKDRSTEYASMFEKGKAWVNENLYNGRYFIQKIDLSDKTLLYPFVESENKDNSEDYINKTYWNEEKQELMYQYGEGSEVDQVLAQYHANLIGLGEIFEKEKLLSSLHTVYEENFKKSLRDFFNPCRNYVLNDEQGTVICAYPDGAKVPKLPIPYAGECMHGFEYAMAVLMMQEGMIEESLELVKAVRNRYDGKYRNPWNEMECGSNYARSMASYALLNASCGFEYDMYKKHIGFAHVKEFEEDGKFRCFVCLDKGYGFVEISENYQRFKLVRGEGFKLRTIRTSRKPLAVYFAGKECTFSEGEKNLAVFSDDLLVDTEHDIKVMMCAE